MKTQLALIIPALLCAGAITGCTSHAAEETAPPAPRITQDSVTFPQSTLPLGIETEHVSSDGDSSVAMPGRLVWDEDHTVRVYSPFSGRVKQIVRKLGDEVAPGDPLAILTSPDYGVAQAEYRKARATQILTQHALSRAKDLAQHGVVAVKDVEQAQADADAAQADAQRAASLLKLFSDDGRSVDQQLVLRAPIEGVIVERSINPGQELRTDAAIGPQFVITDSRSLWVQLDARESDLVSLKPGMHFQFHAGPYPDAVFDGEVIRVSDYVDPLTRTLKVLGRVSNTDHRLKGEMFVSATIAVTREPELEAASAAIFLLGDRHYAFVRTGNGFTRHEVSVSGSRGGRVAVLNGLRDGDEVVTQGALYLQQLLQNHSAG